MARTMTLLNATGDITLAWSEDQDEKMREMIQKKIDEGFSFFIVESAERHVRVLRASDIGEDRTVVIADRDAEALFQAGTLGVVEGAKTSGGLQTRGRARNVDQVVANDTIAVRQMRGG